jgi:threonine/homoserine/homoserine lactone efflux protein
MSPLLLLATIAFAHLLAAMSPGPSFVVVVRNAVAVSRADAVASAFGMGVGATLYAAAALFGLKTVLDQLPALFLAFKIAGALFLLWIAVQIFRHAREPLPSVEANAGTLHAASLWRSFLFALWTQLSNPKCILFFASIFIAMLPPNVPDWMRAAIIAIVFVQETAWYCLVALGFSLPRPRTFYARWKTAVDRAVGTAIGAIGMKLLWDARS